MQAIPQITSKDKNPNFMKGMSLSEYMSQMNFQNTQENDDLWQQKQQNLYTNQEIKDTFKFRPSKQEYEIKQVDQVSHQDSLQYQNYQFQKKLEKEQQTKETFRETNYFNNTPVITNKQHAMNATAYFNNSSVDKNQFRIKHLSNNPNRKKTQSHVGGTLTLYGRKFIKSIGKESNKVPELATFYGKIKQRSEQKISKPQQKRGMSRHNFKKKNQLQLQDLIKFEQNIKSNYSQKIYFQDIRVEGIKDKINERKNRLC